MIHALDAELALIGAALTDAEACVEEIERVRPEHFFDPVHQRIWDATRRLSMNGRADFVSVAEHLAQDKGFADWGGLPMLAELYERGAVWTAQSHAEIILDRAARRAISFLAEDVSKAAFNTGEGTAEEVLSSLERGAADIARDGVSREAWKPLAFVANEAVRIARERRGMPGLSIGLSEVDRITGGLRKGQLTLLAGRPGMGKSTAALQIAKAVAEQGKGVAFFSLEMTEPELGLRMACDMAFDPMRPVYSGEDDNPSYYKAEWGSLDDAQWGRLESAQRAMSSLPVLFDTRPALTSAQIMSAARRIVRNWRKAGIEPGCIIVDHLGLIRPDRQTGNKVSEVAEVSGALREMAKALEVPMVALCQLSRDVEKRESKDRRPGLSDLRWAGELEQDAHVVMFLYRPEYYLKPPEPTGDEEADFMAEAKHRQRLDQVRNKLFWIVAKNRQGPTAEAETFCRIDCSAIRDIRRAA
jgi:replicative DNA helicase